MLFDVEGVRNKAEEHQEKAGEHYDAVSECLEMITASYLELAESIPKNYIRITEYLRAESNKLPDGAGVQITPEETLFLARLIDSGLVEDYSPELADSGSDFIKLRVANHCIDEARKQNKIVHAGSWRGKLSRSFEKGDLEEALTGAEGVGKPHHVGETGGCTTPTFDISYKRPGIDLYIRLDKH